MAITYNPISNGEGADSIRAKFNTFGSDVATEVNSNGSNIISIQSTLSSIDGRLTTAEANIVSNDADIADHETRISVLENTGMTVMSGNNRPIQSIGTTATKVDLFNTIEIDAGVGTSGDVTLDRATAGLDGIYKLRFEAFVKYASNVSITWQMYKNGVAFGNSITLFGHAADPFPIVLISSSNFLAGDYLELYATASATTDLTVTHANGTIEKTQF